MKKTIIKVTGVCLFLVTSIFMFATLRGDVSASGQEVTPPKTLKQDKFEIVSSQQENWGSLAVYADVNTRNGFAVVLDRSGNAVGMQPLTNAAGEPQRFDKTGKILPRLLPEQFKLVVPEITFGGAIHLESTTFTLNGTVLEAADVLTGMFGHNKTQDVHLTGYVGLNSVDIYGNINDVLIQLNGLPKTDIVSLEGKLILDGTISFSTEKFPVWQVSSLWYPSIYTGTGVNFRYEPDGERPAW